MKSPWTFRLPPSYEGRVQRAAKVLGMLDGQGEVKRTAVVLRGLDMVCVEAFVQWCEQHDGLMNSLDVRGARTVILDALEACGSVGRFREVAKIERAEWERVCARFPEVAKNGGVL